MPCTRRGAAAIVVAMTMAAGCASDDAGSETMFPPPDRLDAGAPGPDAGAADGAVGEPFGGLPAGPTSGTGNEQGLAEGTPLSCYDGIDNDGTDGTDCEDPACGGLASCCVARGRCCAPLADEASPLPAQLDFAACTGTDPASCFDGIVPFGDPASRIEADAFVPNGDASYDSGIVAGDPVDLRSHRVTVQATFLAAEACGTSCLESTAIALSTQPAFDDATHVRPVVGLLYGGSGDEVALVVHGETVARWPLQASSETWSLAVRPTGEVTVRREGSALSLPPSGASFVPSSNARLVLYGRNREDAPATDAARLGPVSVDTSVCDMPAAWEKRAPLAFVDGAGEPAPAPLARTPATTRPTGDSVWLAFDSGGAIRFARADAPEGPFRLLDATFAIEPGRSHDAAGVSEPALASGTTGSWTVFYTARASDGTTRIGRATGTTAEELTVDPAPVLAPEDLPDTQWLASPAAHVHPSGTWVLLARAGTPAGEQWRAFVSPDGSSFEPAASPELADTGSDLLADSDALGAWSLDISADVWRLHVARRRGTRWSIVELVSDELLYWRDVGEVLAGSGEGFDRLGASGPAALSTAPGMTLYYAGHDGVRTQLGRATRVTP